MLEAGWILTINEGPIYLKPCPVIHYDMVGMMLAIVRRDRCLFTAQKLLNFHERGDIPGQWGISLDQLPVDCFDEVFGPEGVIEKINHFIPPESDNDEVDEFPPWSSDDLATDLSADLSYSLGDFNQAWCAINSMGLQAISNYLRRYGDLRKGPEQREKERLKAWFWKHKNEFDDGFYDD